MYSVAFMSISSSFVSMIFVALVILLISFIFNYLAVVKVATADADMC